MSPKRRIALTALLGPKTEIDAGKVALLEAIDHKGTIAEAARIVGISYRQALKLLDEMNHAFLKPLTEAVVGGSGGGGATLSAMGRQVVTAYRSMETSAEAAIETDHRALRHLLAPDDPDMDFSARTALVGKVVSLDSDEIMTKVKIALADGQIVTALVTTDSLADIRLRKGLKVTAIIKATKIIIAKDI
jgi:molybdate transport system regulatory protein